MASVFAGLLTGITLTPKYKGSVRALFWGLGAILGYTAAFVSYSINLYNDAAVPDHFLTLLFCQIGILPAGSQYGYSLRLQKKKARGSLLSSFEIFRKQTLQGYNNVLLHRLRVSP